MYSICVHKTVRQNNENKTKWCWVCFGCCGRSCTCRCCRGYGVSINNIKANLRTCYLCQMVKFFIFRIWPPILILTSNEGWTGCGCFWCHCGWFRCNKSSFLCYCRCCSIEEPWLCWTESRPLNLWVQPLSWVSNISKYRGVPILWKIHEIGFKKSRIYTWSLQSHPKLVAPAKICCLLSASSTDRGPPLSP